MPEGGRREDFPRAGLVVRLTEAMATALRREAQARLEDYIGERALLRRSAAGVEVVECERGLLACADVLGALILHPDRGSPVEFSTEAVWWMRLALEESRAHLERLAADERAEYEHAAQETYLVDVLERVLAAARDAARPAAVREPIRLRDGAAPLR